MSATVIAPAVHGTASDRSVTSSARARRTEATPPVAGPLRLTARGRLVVWRLGVVLAVALGGATASAQADGPSPATEVERVVVAPGQTMWGIAAAIARPGEDVRDVVQELVTLNELSTAGLMAGQTIVVPVR